MHLAVLYASPLGYEEADGRGGKRFKTMQQLRFPNELAQISQALKRSQNSINYSYRLGTSFNFIQSLSKNPNVLHFIGHGIKQEQMRRMNDFLVLENEDGSG